MKRLKRGEMRLDDLCIDLTRGVVDLDGAPLMDTRAQDEEAERLEALKASGRLRMYDAFYSFHRMVAA